MLANAMSCYCVCVLHNTNLLLLTRKKKKYLISDFLKENDSRQFSGVLYVLHDATFWWSVVKRGMRGTANLVFDPWKKQNRTKIIHNFFNNVFYCIQYSSLMFLFLSVPSLLNRGFSETPSVSCPFTSCSFQDRNLSLEETPEDAEQGLS